MKRRDLPGNLGTAPATDMRIIALTGARYQVIIINIYNISIYLPPPSRTSVVEHIPHIMKRVSLMKIQPVGNSDRFGRRAIDIISLGYRIKSSVATNFQRWATERLKAE